MDSKVTLELPSGCEVIVRKIDNSKGKTGYEEKCSFCGKHISEIKRLIVASGVSICDECIELSYGILIKENIVTVNDKIDDEVREIIDKIDDEVREIIDKIEKYEIFNGKLYAKYKEE